MVTNLIRFREASRVVSFIAALYLVVVLAGCTKSAQEGNASHSARVLNLYCWANYFSPDVIKRFEEKTKVKVNLDYFSSNEELLAKLQAGARGYDLIVPTAYMVTALKELKLIEPLGKLDWPELKNISARFKVPNYDPNHEYTIPYSWGTTGIAVNRAKVKDKVDSLSWLFDHPELKGQITMLDDAPTVIGTALKYLGYSYNESSPEAFARAKELLVKQKKLLKSFTPEAQPVLESGEVAIAQAYSGDVLQVKNRKNPNIEYVLPKEGGELFVDNLAIPKGAASPELAKEFMRFTLGQDIAVTQVKHLFFSPIVDVQSAAEARPLLTNSAVFPTDDQLKKFETMQENPQRIEAIQKLWTELKSM